MGHIGLGPPSLITGFDERVLAHHHLAPGPANRVPGVAIQKVGAAGEIRAHHRFAQQHRLGQRATEAFGAVQRHIGVAGVHQTQHARPVQRAVEQRDARVTGTQIDKLTPGLAVRSAVHGLEHQAHRSVIDRKSLLKSGNHSLRILAREVRVEVKDEQEQEALGRQAQRAARGSLQSGHAHRQRHQRHRPVGPRAEHGLRESGRSPDLIQHRKRRPPALRPDRQFPRPPANVVSAIEQRRPFFSVHPQRVEAGQTEQVDGVGQVGDVVGAMGRHQPVSLAQVLAGIDVEHFERHASRCASLRRHAQVFANAQLAKGKTDQVDPERSPADPIQQRALRANFLRRRTGQRLQAELLGAAPDKPVLQADPARRRGQVQGLLQRRLAAPQQQHQPAGLLGCCSIRKGRACQCSQGLMVEPLRQAELTQTRNVKPAHSIPKAHRRRQIKGARQVRPMGKQSAQQAVHAQPTLYRPVRQGLEQVAPLYLGQGVSSRRVFAVARQRPPKQKSFVSITLLSGSDRGKHVVPQQTHGLQRRYAHGQSHVPALTRNR